MSYPDIEVIGTTVPDVIGTYVDSGVLIAGKPRYALSGTTYVYLYYFITVTAWVIVDNRQYVLDPINNPIYLWLQDTPDADPPGTYSPNDTVRTNLELGEGIATIEGESEPEVNSNFLIMF